MRMLILILLCVGIVLHAVASHRWKAVPNEGALADAVAAAWAGDERFSGATIAFDHLDGRIGGRVPDEAAREELLAIAHRSKPAGRISGALEIVAPRNRAANLTVSGAEGAIRLAGVVGDMTLRDGLGAALAPAAGRPVENGILVSEQVRDPSWAKTAGPYITRFLQHIPSGSLELSETQLVLKGRVLGEKARDTVLAEARAFLPEGTSLVAEIDLLPDRPARIVAKRSGNAITLEGRLPSPADAGPLLASLVGLPGEVANLVEADPRVVDPPWVSPLAGFLPTFFKEGDGVVTLEGNRLTLAGDRPASRGRKSWEDALAPLRQAGCEISDTVRLVPDLEPELHVRLADGVIRLEGRLPEKSLLSAWEKAFPGWTVENRLSADPAVSEPAWPAGIIDLAGDFFQGADTGELDLLSRSLRLKRAFPSRADQEAFLAHVAGQLPDGATLIDQTAVAASEASSLRIVFGAKGWSLEGRLPDEAAIHSLVGAAQTAAGNVPVDADGLAAGATGTADWLGIVIRFLPRFAASTRGGVLEVRDGKVTLSGETADPAVRDALLAELSSSLPEKSLKVESKLGTVPSAAAAPASAGAVPVSKVFFNKNSDWIRPDGSATVAEAAGRITALPPDTTVLVKGFADSRGDPATNQVLSELRALAVIERLVSLGVKRTQLELIAVGETESRAGTSETIWSEDRRVEVTPVRK